MRDVSFVFVKLIINLCVFYGYKFSFLTSLKRYDMYEIVLFQYWEKAEFPYHVIPTLSTLRIAGGTIKGYGCPGLSLTGSAIAIAEMARVDASVSTFILVHSSLAMLTIG